MKNRNLITIFTALSLSCISSMAVFAGWEEAGETWVYRNNEGQLLVNEWRNGVDNIPRWLGSDGKMVMGAWVDGNESYVDKDGKRIQNNWISLPVGEGENQKYEYFYFDSKGKLVTNKWVKVDNNRVYVGEDGTLVKGWLEDNTYYTDEGGFMLRGWQKLFPPDYEPPAKALPFDEAENHKVWYYFGENGKKFTSGEEGTVRVRSIDGAKYCFDDSGKMLTGWVNVKGKSISQTTIKDFMYFNLDGTQRFGWFTLNPPKDIMQSYEEEVEWFYFDANGYPKAASDSVLRATDFVKLQDKTYLFADNGVPVYGLVRIYNGRNYDVYYLGNTDQRYVQKGLIDITESTGETVPYYFDVYGKGFTGVKDDKLYYMGKLQASPEEGRYRVVSVTVSGANRNYVVNRQGKIVKNTKVRSEDKQEYKTSATGILLTLNGESVDANERFESPIEPDIN